MFLEHYDQLRRSALDYFTTAKCRNISRHVTYSRGSGRHEKRACLVVTRDWRDLKNDGCKLSTFRFAMMFLPVFNDCLRILRDTISESIS